MAHELAHLRALVVSHHEACPKRFFAKDFWAIQRVVVQLLENTNLVITPLIHLVQHTFTEAMLWNAIPPSGLNCATSRSGGSVRHTVLSM